LPSYLLCDTSRGRIAAVRATSLARGRSHRRMARTIRIIPASNRRVVISSQTSTLTPSLARVPRRDACQGRLWSGVEIRRVKRDAQHAYIIAATSRCRSKYGVRPKVLPRSDSLLPEPDELRVTAIETLQFSTAHSHVFYQMEGRADRVSNP